MHKEKGNIYDRVSMYILTANRQFLTKETVLSDVFWQLGKVNNKMQSLNYLHNKILVYTSANVFTSWQKLP